MPSQVSPGALFGRPLCTRLDLLKPDIGDLDIHLPHYCYGLSRVRAEGDRGFGEGLPGKQSMPIFSRDDGDRCPCVYLPFLQAAVLSAPLPYTAAKPCCPGGASCS